MKYVELFENVNNKEYWLVDYYIKQETSHSYCLYPDEESAELVAITIINNEREEYEGENYDDSKFFSDFDEAMDWYEDTFRDIVINVERIKLSKKIEGSDKLRMLRAAKKYNI